MFAATNAWVYLAIITVAIVMLLLSMLILVSRQYKRCPSNRVLVIYGKAGREGEAAKTIHGGAAFVWPLIQDYAYLSLEPIQIEIPLRGALSIGEHPRQRAQRVHRGHRHRAGSDAQRGHPPAGTRRPAKSANRPRRSSSASCAR